jgi:hypothetical protein
MDLGSFLADTSESSDERREDEAGTKGREEIRRKRDG